MTRFGDARDWFFENRFGLFLHFGLYALAGWHEQDQMRRRIPRAEYARLARRFNPRQFNADRLLDLAASVGMRYVCLTAKHHDGFCLWNTDHTAFNSLRTPCGRDFVGELADACHRRNFPFGLYYSIADWHHPNYPNQGRHHELATPEPGDRPDWNAYLDTLRAQVTELCTRYGTVKYWFWDMNVPGHVDPSINALLRRLQPAMVINDRGFDPGDFGTPEREYHAAEVNAVWRFERPTEATNSVGTQSWGYRRDEDYYSVRFLMQSIDASLSKGGNFLLNVGPDAQGRIPRKAATILRRIGDWYQRVSASYAAEPASNLLQVPGALATRDGGSLYVHLPQQAATGVVLKPLTVLPRRVVLLNTGAELEATLDLLPAYWQTGQRFLRVRGLPVDALAHEIPVLRLDFDAPPTPGAAPAAEAFAG